MKHRSQHSALRRSAGIVAREYDFDEVILCDLYIVQSLPETANLILDLILLRGITVELHNLHARMAKRVVAQFLKIG
jgi:hypothetical protein